MRERLCLGLVAVALSAATLCAWAAPVPGPPVLALRACDDAISIDGWLRCGDDVASSLDALCEGAGLRVREPVCPGDALESALLCGKRGLRRGDRGWGRMPPHEQAALGLPVDLNRASLEELRSLPGIGPSRAEAIVAARPFTHVDELLAVRGVGPVTLARLRSRAVVGSRTRCR